MDSPLSCFACFKYAFPQLNPRARPMSEDENGESQEQQEECISSSKKKYELIKHLRGGGPPTAQKLRDCRYHPVESLAMATARELEPVGVGEKKAFQIIEAERSALGISLVRADELYTK